MSNKASIVEGNVTLLRSAIENVVRNGARYTDEATTVDVSLETNGRDAIVRVHDQGPGVPEESLPKLFLPFYRVDATRDRNTGGVGLGLSIAERAVRRHGGFVELTRIEDALCQERGIGRTHVGSDGHSRKRFAGCCCSSKRLQEDFRS